MFTPITQHPLTDRTNCKTDITDISNPIKYDFNMM